MKIVAINGSSRGRASNTHVMVSALLNGAQAAGAETVNVLLAEKEISHCRGCHSCWSATPGQCVTDDDMLGVLGAMAGASVVILASPVYFENISGLLKTFMDRLTVIGSPHTRPSSASGHASQPTSLDDTPIKLVMVANCGYADPSEFAVISHWFRRVSQKLHMGIAGEIYAPQGKILAAPPEELRPAALSYLQTLEEAGKELVTDHKLSPRTAALLGQGIVRR
ncbi:MAG: flavodoxin family protein [Bacillota bacterium]